MNSASIAVIVPGLDDQKVDYELINKMSKPNQKK